MSYYQEYEKDQPVKTGSKIMGVCAGAAHQFGWNVTTVRMIAVVGLFTFTGLFLLTYIIAGVVFY